MHYIYNKMSELTSTSGSIEELLAELDSYPDIIELKKYLYVENGWSTFLYDICIA
jgi:hypothetical protein